MAGADQLVASDVGEIPASWQVLRFGDLVETRLGKMLSPKARTGAGSRPYLRNANVQWDRIHIDDLLEMDFSEEERQKFRLVPGDLLICEGGEVGRAALWRGELSECYYQKAIHRVRPKDGRVANEFLLYHFMNAFLLHDTYGTQGTETTIAHLPAVKLRALPIPVPPLEEQRAIAHVLRTVQRAKEAAEAVVAAARQLKRSLLRHLFTYGPVPVAQADRVPLKETEIGPMPSTWEIAKIGDVTTAVGSGVTPRGGAKTYLKDGVPLIRSQNVLMNRLELSDVAYISNATHEEMARSALHPGDVLLNITGASIGRTAVVPSSLGSANVNQHVCRIRLTAECVPVFVSYYLSSESGQSQVFGSQYGATRQGLNYAQVRAMLLPKPTHRVQQAIVDSLSAIDAKLASEQVRASALDALFMSLLRDLMTGRVRVGDQDLPIPTEGRP